MSRDKKLAQISVRFEKNIRKKYPFAKSLYDITLKLNEEIEKEIYGMMKFDKK